MTRPIAVDLFSGAGGFSLGFEQAGFDIAAAIELDPIHAATHELNFPRTPVLCCDIRELTGSSIRQATGIGCRAIDAVIGGPPCQGFSFIGHRDVGDPRNSLILHYARIVQELNPRVFVMENVPGMVAGEHKTLLDTAICRLTEAGYRVREPLQVLNAADYGVPQQRRRLFVIGARGRTAVPHYPSPTTLPRSHRGGRPPKRSAATLPLCPSVADAIGDLPDIELASELSGTDEWRVRLGEPSAYAARLRGEERDRSDYSYRRVMSGRGLTGCLRAAHTQLSRSRFRRTAPGTVEPISRFLRLAPDGVCNTLRAGTASDRGAFSAPRPIHPYFARCISVREAARLHSYPDWFRFHRTIWHGFRQIGNSVPPLLGRAVAAEVVKALGLSRERPRAAIRPGSDNLASLDMRNAAAHFGVSPHVIPQRIRKAH